jgi:cation diffusion facilitator family transporter
MMSDCGCRPGPVETKAQQRALWIALALNAAMFLTEITAGTLVHSSGLIADGLDMLSDAAAYAIALAAIDRGPRFKANAASTSGVLLLILGAGVIIDVLRRIMVGTAPEGEWMIAVSAVALGVNIAVLRLLKAHREGEVHLRAAWIFTRADVVANAAVLVSGLAVLATGIRYFDLIVGAAIGVYVIREAAGILAEARAAKAE